MGKKFDLLFSLFALAVILTALVAFAVSADVDTDLDGISDSEDQYPYDYDNDGMPDVWEKKYGLRYDINDANEDPDGDGIKSIDEYRQGTDPLAPNLQQQKDLLSPVEQGLMHWLIWVGSIMVMVSLLSLLLFHRHMFRIFSFLHHASKQHFEQQEMMQRIAATQRTTTFPSAGAMPTPMHRPQQQWQAVQKPQGMPPLIQIPEQKRWSPPPAQMPQPMQPAGQNPSAGGYGTQGAQQNSRAKMPARLASPPKQTPLVPPPSAQKAIPAQEDPFSRLAQETKTLSHDEWRAEYLRRLARIK